MSFNGPSIVPWVVQGKSTQLFETLNDLHTVVILEVFYSTNLSTLAQCLVLIVSDGTYFIPLLIDPEAVKDQFGLIMLDTNSLNSLRFKVITICRSSISLYRRGKTLAPYIIALDFKKISDKPLTLKSDIQDVSKNHKVKQWIQIIEGFQLPKDKQISSYFRNKEITQLFSPFDEIEYNLEKIMSACYIKNEWAVPQPINSFSNTLNVDNNDEYQIVKIQQPVNMQNVVSIQQSVNSQSFENTQQSVNSQPLGKTQQSVSSLSLDNAEQQVNSQPLGNTQQSVGLLLLDNLQQSLNSLSSEDTQKLVNTQKSINTQKLINTQQSVNTQKSVKTQQSVNTQQSLNTAQSIKLERSVNIEQPDNTQQSVDVQKPVAIQQPSNSQQLANTNENPLISSSVTYMDDVIEDSSQTASQITAYSHKDLFHSTLVEYMDDVIEHSVPNQIEAYLNENPCFAEEKLNNPISSFPSSSAAAVAAVAVATPPTTTATTTATPTTTTPTTTSTKRSSPKSITLTTTKLLEKDLKIAESPRPPQNSKLEIYQSPKEPAMLINNIATTTTSTKLGRSLKRTISESVIKSEPIKRANLNIEPLTNSPLLTKLSKDELRKVCQNHILNEQQIILDAKSISFERINSFSGLKSLCYMHYTEK